MPSVANGLIKAYTADDYKLVQNSRRDTHLCYSSISILNGSVISDNSASSFGGGIFADDYAGGIVKSSTIAVSNSTLSNNSATTGGGILVRGYSSVSLSNSTLSGNFARNFGGGVASQSQSSISLINSTVSGNSTDADGGGIFADGGLFQINNSTVFNNSANRDGGGIFISAFRNSLSNSIIANSSAGGDCALASTFGGAVNVDSATIIEDSSCGSVARSGDPGLLPLADNGGLTLTHALRTNSFASNRGILGGAEAGFQNCTATDQRGETRNIGDNACDVGAFELNESTNFNVIPLGNGRVVVIPL